VTNTNNEGLVVDADSDLKPFRALPADLRASILSLKKEVEAQIEETEEGSVSTPVVPPTPAGAEEDENFGDDLEAMFSQRPEDIELIDEYAKDFTVKAGVDEKAAYGYALDAYLEGVSEFWGHVETIQEEEAEEMADEEDVPLPDMGAANDEEEVDATAVVTKRQSLANTMTESLCDILNPKEDAIEEESEKDELAAVASSVAGSLCQLLTNTAMANISAKQGSEVEEKVRRWKVAGEWIERKRRCSHIILFALRFTHRRSRRSFRAWEATLPSSSRAARRAPKRMPTPRRTRLSQPTSPRTSRTCSTSRTRSLHPSPSRKTPARG
jgi:hypothetical protein